VDLIDSGRGSSVKFPTEPSMKFAVVTEMVHRSLKEWTKYYNCIRWMITKCDREPEWTSSFIQDVVKLLQANDKKKHKEYLGKLMPMPEVRRFIQEQTEAGGFK